MEKIFKEILKNYKSTVDIVPIGIHTRGVPFARRFVNFLNEKFGKKISLGYLDITLYRDDLSTISEQPIIKETNIPFDITGKNLIIFDDVLYTGRTVRCAIDAIIDFGRPKSIKLAVIFDRGSRELPIQPDFSGIKKFIPEGKIVEVHLKEIDKEDAIYLVNPKK